MNTERIEFASKYSHLDTFAFSNCRYASHYAKAFELLYSKAGDEPIDTFSLPILFLLRHYLELIIKHNIKVLSKYSKDDDYLSIIESSHDLSKLKKGFYIHLNKVEKKYKTLDTFRRDDVDYLVDIMDSLDKGSYNFRYSHSKNGEMNFESEPEEKKFKVDIYNLKKRYDEASVQLDGLEGVLDNQMPAVFCPA